MREPAKCLLEASSRCAFVPLVLRAIIAKSTSTIASRTPVKMAESAKMALIRTRATARERGKQSIQNPGIPRKIHGILLFAGILRLYSLKSYSLIFFLEI